MKKIVIFLMIISILINTDLSVHASQSNYDFYEITKDNLLCYTSDDPNLPTTGNYYFGLNSSGDVWYTPINKAIPIILNKGIGITLKPEVLVDFFSDYLEFGIVNGIFNKPVYNGNTKIGYAYESLTGHHLIGSGSSDNNITMPSSEVNNVYNYYNTWFTQEGYNEPDYVNVETRTNDFYLNKLDQNNTYYAARSAFLSGEYGGLIPMSYNPSNLTYSTNTYFVSGDINDLYLIANNSQWSSFLSRYHLTVINNTLTFTDQLLGQTGIDVTFKYLDNGIQTKYLTSVNMGSTGTYTTSSSSQTALTLFYYNRVPCSPMSYLTLYKDTTVLNQFVNGTYAPVSFYSQEYYDYSTEDDNSFTATSNEYDNSNTTNETIYNNSAESFSDYYEENNYHVDNSVTINTTTEVINNYYGEEPGPDPTPDPDNPDDDDDDGLIDRLLEALMNLFKQLGKVIAAILTGIVEMINEVLGALADIITAINPFTNLLRILFGFLPEIVVNTISAGLAICIMIAVLKFLRG